MNTNDFPKVEVHHLLNDVGVVPPTAMTTAELQTLFSDAIQADLEHGVQWMNEAASKEFADKYPRVSKALETLFNLETGEE